MTLWMIFIKNIIVKSGLFFKSHIYQDPRVSRSRFFRVQIFRSSTFLIPGFFRTHVFQGQGPRSKFLKLLIFFYLHQEYNEHFHFWFRIYNIYLTLLAQRTNLKETLAVASFQLLENIDSYIALQRTSKIYCKSLLLILLLSCHFNYTATKYIN